MTIETLYATSHLAGTFTNPTNAVGSSTSTWAGQLNTNTSETSRWAIDDPVDPLTSAATQTINVWAKKGSNSGVPTLQINLYENGTLISSGTAQNVTSTTGQTISRTFNSSAITNRANVEIELVMTAAGGSPSARNSAQVAYIQWSADTTASAAHDLTGVGNLTHGHGIGAVTLTQDHDLTVADLAHGSTVGAVTLTQVHTLGGVADLGHASTIDAPALSQVHDLAVTDLAHDHGIDGNLSLAGAITLTVADLEHDHTLDAPTLEQVHSLAGVADLDHASTVDAVTLTQFHELVVADLAHSHTIDTLTITGAGEVTLAVSDLEHDHTLEVVALGQVHNLTVDDLTHTHTEDSLTMSIPGAVSAGPVVPRWKARTSSARWEHDRAVSRWSATALKGTP